MNTGPLTLSVVTACSILLAANIAVASASADSLLTARVEVAADLDSASVVLDSVHVGKTPLILDGVPPGTHILRILPPRPDAWTVRPAIDTVVLLQGQTHTFSYQLRTFIPVRSDPDGAQLYMNDSLAYVTPALVRSSDLHPDTRLELRMNGFEPVVILPSALTGETALTVALKAGWRDPAGDTPSVLVSRNAWDSRTVGQLVSGGVSILAGIGAAYFKIAADEKQEAYLATGDPAFASGRRRLDTMAGISLALAQAGIIVLSWLLITE